LNKARQEIDNGKTYAAPIFATKSNIWDPRDHKEPNFVSTVTKTITYNSEGKAVTKLATKGEVSIPVTVPKTFVSIEEKQDLTLTYKVNRTL
jgi:hypothetical protein